MMLHLVFVWCTTGILFCIYVFMVRPDPAGGAHDAPRPPSQMGKGISPPHTPPLDAFGASFAPNLFFIPVRLFVQSRRRAGLQKC